MQLEINVGNKQSSRQFIAYGDYTVIGSLARKCKITRAKRFSDFLNALGWSCTKFDCGYDDDDMNIIIMVNPLGRKRLFIKIGDVTYYSDQSRQINNGKTEVYNRFYKF